MDKKPLIKILKYLDGIYVEEGYENGNYNYQYAYSTFPQIFEKLVNRNDYLNFDDYFDELTGLSFNSESLLTEQFSGVEDEDTRVKICEALYSLILVSEDKQTATRFIRFIKRYGYVFLSNNESRKMVKNVVTSSWEGSFADIIVVSDEFIVKSLKHSKSDDSEYVKRFKYEFEIQNDLSDIDGILKVYEYNDIEMKFTMDRADSNIERYLELNNLSFEEKTTLIKKFLNVFSAIHERKILHRDFHPGNILIKNTSPFISDFGMAKDTKVERSLITTHGPKLRHMFIDSDVWDDFTKYTYRHDVYAASKMIDYIMGDRQFEKSHVYSVVVRKGTRDKERTESMNELSNQIESVHNSIKNNLDVEEIYENITNGVYEFDVENYIVGITVNYELSEEIVANKWNQLGEVLKHFSVDNLEKVLACIDDTYVNATGYGGWENYEIFADIAYSIITDEDVHSENRVLACYILKGCCNHRGYACDLMKTAKRKVYDVQIRKLLSK